jgi:hypothetical protein
MAVAGDGADGAGAVHLAEAPVVGVGDVEIAVGHGEPGDVAQARREGGPLQALGRLSRQGSGWYTRCPSDGAAFMIAVPIQPTPAGARPTADEPSVP